MTDKQKPLSPKLKSAMDEIRAIINRYDIAGSIVLHTPGNSEYGIFIEPSYSCAKFNGGNISFKAKASDFKGGAAERSEKVEDTCNMMNMLSTTTGQVALNIMHVSENFDKHIGAEHTKMNHRGHGEKRKDEDETDSEG